MTKAFENTTRPVQKVPLYVTQPANAFVEAVKGNKDFNLTTTTNGMVALKSTLSATVDLFSKAGAMRGKDISALFEAAFNENAEYALRIALWLRDIRHGGAGERELFRKIMLWLEKNKHFTLLGCLMRKTPTLGRWDDLLIFQTPEVLSYAFDLIAQALDRGDGLCAKWMPRKGPVAVTLRNYLGWTPKYYRKRLVELTKVVETQMCAKDWDNINFSHVPSVASARYKKAFGRHSAKYAEYIQKLVKGDKTVKVNASAVYPYDLLKGLIYTAYSTLRFTQQDLDHITAQWNALPNYVGDKKVLALVDVSGSMTNWGYSSSGKRPTFSPLDVAVSLGLYVADKNLGVFKDTFLTFSSDPELLYLKGSIVEKIKQMADSKWTMSTDLEKALMLILKTAINGRAPQAHMPDMLLIMSDMQFNAAGGRFTAYEMIEKKYKDAGYEMPKIVFWTINADKNNSPVVFDQSGAALVSGFSPGILKSVLSGNLKKENFTPEAIMLETIMKDVYNPY